MNSASPSRSSARPCRDVNRRLNTRGAPFSIAAYDVVAGCAGVAVSSRMPSIGALSVFARAASGAIATQALINPLLGIDGLELLRTHSA
ncbi:DUF1028 domain-containing protein, partial [Saccharopolyspora shandongensis]|uniref:DUF1028 domain-containing protein n=1 Tax=Saccharopolyspora shandongensis TaxID=418495 RepID=UPI0033D9C4A5